MALFEKVIWKTQKINDKDCSGKGIFVAKCSETFYLYYYNNIIIIY